MHFRTQYFGFRSAALAAIATLAAYGASAQDPACTAENALAASRAAPTLMQAWNKDIAVSIEELGKRCPDDAEIQFARAQAWFLSSRLPDVPPENQASYVLSARTILDHIETLDTAPRNYTAYSQLSQDSLLRLVSISNTYNLAPQDDFTVCPKGSGAVASTIWREYKASRTGFAPVYLEKLAVVCADPAADIGVRSPLLYYATYLLDDASLMTDPSAAMARTREAEQAADTFAGDAESLGVIYRDTFDQLMEGIARQDAIAQQGKPVDIAALFTGPKIKQAYRAAMIGYIADAVWDEDVTPGSADNKPVWQGQMRAYHAMTQEMDAIIRPLGTEARAAMFAGLKGQADGKFRLPGHESFKPPPEVLWKAFNPAPD